MCPGLSFLVNIECSQLFLCFLLLWKDKHGNVISYDDDKVKAAVEFYTQSAVPREAT